MRCLLRSRDVSWSLLLNLCLVFSQEKNFSRGRTEFRTFVRLLGGWREVVPVCEEYGLGLHPRCRTVTVMSGRREIADRCPDTFSRRYTAPSVFSRRALGCSPSPVVCLLLPWSCKNTKSLDFLVNTS